MKSIQLSKGKSIHIVLPDDRHITIEALNDFDSVKITSYTHGQETIESSPTKVSTNKGHDGDLIHVTKKDLLLRGQRNVLMTIESFAE